MDRWVALSLEKGKPSKPLSIHSSDNNMNKTNINIVNKCFYQEGEIASQKEDEEKIQRALECDIALACHIIF